MGSDQDRSATVVFVGWPSSNRASRRRQPTGRGANNGFRNDAAGNQLGANVLWSRLGIDQVAAAAAWERQAACLNDEAAQWRTVTSKLTKTTVQSAAPT